MTRALRIAAIAWRTGLAGLVLATTACDGAPGSARKPAPHALIHLTERVDDASIESAAPPEAARRGRRWRAADLALEWRTLASETRPDLARAERITVDDAVRLVLHPAPEPQGPIPIRVAGLAIDLPQLQLADWETVLVRARSRDRFAGIALAHNLDEPGAVPGPRRFFMSPDGVPPVFNDGSVQTYALPLTARNGDPAAGELRSLGVFFGAPGDASIDVLSIGLVPRGAAYAEGGGVGVRHVTRAGTTRYSLFAHAPARIAFPIEVPLGGRLDLGFAVQRGDAITYGVKLVSAGRKRVLLEKTIDAAEEWLQKSIPLGEHEGESVELVLEASSERPGAVALWGAPIVSGSVKPADRPNVVFYVIDGAGADSMSVYGYGRPTTPYLEELAEEGVLFTRAYANSTWTQPSTVSFMTSLQHSVLGGLRRGVHSTAVPTAATTLAEHFRRAGYQTASLGANPNAGRIIGIERGMDLMRDVETAHHSTSSDELQQGFWRFRAAYPGMPYWVHFQTTDVHEPNLPEEPFAGRFVLPTRRRQLEAWDESVRSAGAGAFGTTSIGEYYDRAIAEAGVDRKAYYATRRDLYDETMLHQDESLRRLVTELKKRGEWERTLLIIGSDHGHPAGTFARWGRGLIEPRPEPWQGALFDAHATRIPLLVVWPGQIEGGRRIEHPVSMLDVLPTLLDLAGLPAAEVQQGRSLAPWLRGQSMEPAPVILDEFRIDEATGEPVGNLEIVDGRWGASLEIGPSGAGAAPERGRHVVPAGGRWGAVHPFFPEVPRLLLYDLEADPYASRAVNDEHPERVAHYHEKLLEHWRAHRSLAEKFEDSSEAALSPGQLEQLRTLGYIQ